MPQREGADPLVSAMFYRAFVQTVLLLGAETWVLLVAMYNTLEGVHVVFLRQVIRKRSKKQRDGTWIKSAVASVLK